MHLRPQSFQNLETFANVGTGSCDLSMADLSQQTMAMNAQLRDVGRVTGQAGERLLSPRRVGGALSEVGISSQSVLGSESWLPQQVAASSSPPSNPLAGCVEATELERLVRNQMENAPQMAHAAQVLQNIQSQIGPFQADFLQQTMQEIAKRYAAPEGLNGEWGAAAVAALAHGNAGAASVGGIPGMPNGVPVDQFGSWSNWGPRPLSAPPVASACGSSLSLNKGEDKPSDGQTLNQTGRIEELNQYIRQQSQEYMEGQAEWSRQIAEVKSECLRELEKVKREKEEVKRQARQEILRLNQRLRDLGVKDEGTAAAQGAHGGDSPNSQQVGSWAHGVSMDEYQQVHRKWIAAEERIQQLEEYIKDQSAKQLMSGETPAKDKGDEIQKLRQCVLFGGMELQQVTSELQALRGHHEHKVQLWEQGVARLLAVAEQFLGQRNVRSGEEDRCENGHFGRTATKLTLTLSQGKEGGNVDSLRRLLKDALAQPEAKSRGKEKKSTRRAKEEGQEQRPCPSAEEPALEEGKVEELRRPEDNNKSGEGECSTPGPLEVAGPAHLSDSNSSSRETSPGRGVLVGRNGYGGDSPHSAGAVLPFLAQLVGEIRQLMALSQQTGSPPTSPAASSGPSPQGSPRSASATAASASATCSPEIKAALPPMQQPQAGSPAQVERGHVHEILDAIGPARKGIATNIIAVEKMLRSLERDLRKHCEDVLGQAELEVQLLEGLEAGAASADHEDVRHATAAADEARKRVPLDANGQILSMSALRRAQQRSSALLAQFVQLPQKLKTVFDLAKKLGTEVHGLVPQSTLQQVEASRLQAEQRQAFQVELLQKRIAALTMKVCMCRICQFDSLSTLRIAAFLLLQRCSF
jgi:hypothetical protein